jgi:hypothetical protein
MAHFPEPRSLFVATHQVMKKLTSCADTLTVDGRGVWKQDRMAPLEEAWASMAPADATAATASRLLFYGLVSGYFGPHGLCPVHWPLWDEPSVLSRFVAFCMDRGADPTVSLATFQAEIPRHDNAHNCVFNGTNMHIDEEFDADINAVVLMVAYLLRPVPVANPDPFGSLVTMLRGARAPLTVTANCLCTWMCIRTKNEALLGQLVAFEEAFAPMVTDQMLDMCIYGNNMAGLAMALRIGGPTWGALEYRKLEEVIDHRTPGLAVLLCQRGGPEVRAQTGAYANADGNTLLIRACKNGNLPVARVLIRECGADVNAANRFGETPLWWAAKNGHPGIVRLLLQHKAADRRARLVANLYGRHTVVRELRAADVARKWRTFYLSRLIERMPGHPLDAGIVRYIVGKVVG